MELSSLTASVTLFVLESVPVKRGHREKQRVDLHQGVRLLLFLKNSCGSVQLLQMRLASTLSSGRFLSRLGIVFTSFFSPPEGSLVEDVRIISQNDDREIGT